MIKKYTISTFNNVLILAIVVFGIYLCFVGGYGSDEDTLAMIYVFEKKLFEGSFASSRFTGYPVAELGIGFLAHFFGSWASNLITFLLLIIGLIYFYFSFAKKKFDNDLIIFLILCLSSPVLFFDNVESIDYSWAFFFYSIGLYYLRKNLFEFSIIFFGLAIGTRINFTLFVIVVIFINDLDFKKNFKRKFFLATFSIFIGGLFYLPIWFDNHFGLDWLAAGRPIEQGLTGLILRFLYKTFLASGGVFAGFFIIYIICKYYNKIINNKYFVLIASLGISNLLIFLWIPAELSYMQPFLIFLYFALLQSIKKKYIYILIFLNFVSWGYNLELLQVNYRYQDKCMPIQALSANFAPRIKYGHISKFYKSRDMINCWATGNSPRSIKIRAGKALK